MKNELIEKIKKVGEFDGVGYLFYVPSIQIEDNEEILSVGVYKDDDNSEQLLAAVIVNDTNFYWLNLLSEVKASYPNAFDIIINELKKV